MLIRRRIQEACLTDEILLYSGADEVALTLASRMLNDINGKKPGIYVKYAAEAAKNLYPLYEGVRLGTTIGYHILSAGCIQVERLEAADIILVVTAPDCNMEEASEQPSLSPNYNAERNMAEILRFIRQQVTQGSRIAIADNAYANGGELDFVRMLDKHQLLMKVCGYAGWNTDGNTLGTVLAEAVYDYYYGNTEQKRKFLIERYIEDAGYCSLVRKQVSDTLESMDMNYFDVSREETAVTAMVKGGLEEFVKHYLPSVAEQVKITQVSMPWRRMFEVRLEAELE